MSNLAEKLPEELEQQSLTLYEQALSLKISDQATFSAAGEFAKGLKDLETKIIAYHKPIKQSIDATKQAALDREKADLSPVREALTVVRAAMNAWANEQERIRREEEARLRRIEEERAAKERERLLAQAVKAEEKGKEERAADLLEQAENVYAAPVTVAPKVETAKFEGGSVGMAKELQVSVIDLKAFVTALVKDNHPPMMLEVKASPLKAWVKANAFKTFPGLHIQETLSARIR
jgi:hypothetical protein